MPHPSQRVVAAAVAAAAVLLALGGGITSAVRSPPRSPAAHAGARPGSPGAARRAVGVRAEPLTAAQADLERDGVRLRLRGAGRVTVRAYLAPAGAPWPLAATVARRVRAPGTVRLALTAAGRLAAGSCVPLVLSVRAGPRTGRRALRPACAAPAPPADAAYQPMSSPPVDPSQLAQLPFGTRSQWLQPWRAWPATPPATRLRAALGVNFNVDARHARSAARRLAAAGFARARIELGWNALDYRDPRRLANPAAARRILGALRAAGLRPLILLNANQQEPGPSLHWQATLRAPAPAGARTVELAPRDGARVRPGLAGFDALGSDRRPDVLITRVDRRGLATLARPLPLPLAAGPHPVSTLRYGPFAPVRRTDGSPSPAFAATLRGWLGYVAAVTRFAHRVLGGWGFDVEVWNELSFDSDFLDAGRYYDPPPAGSGDVEATILARTVAWLRDPTHGIGPIGIADGFASETPFAAGSTSPRGLTALSKHPYVALQQFPGAAAAHADQRDVGALGGPAGDFVPTYDAYFPEYWLTGIQTETLLRDLSPRTTKIGGVAHGRAMGPPGGRPPGMWLTEFNLAPIAGQPAAALAHARAKALMRALVAYVHAGAGALDVYAATGGGYGLLGEPEPLADLARLTGALADARAARARPLRIVAVAGATSRTEFAGDGTPLRPPLYDRDLLAAFPFQVDAHDWAVAVYVMTRDVRADVPAAPFRLTLGGLRGAHARAGLYDPASGRFEPLRVSARTRGRLTVELPASDSVRLLLVGDGP